VNLEPALRLADRLGVSPGQRPFDGLAHVVRHQAKQPASWRLELQWQDSA